MTHERGGIEGDAGQGAEGRVVVWVHGDCLDPGGPALAAHPGSPAVWVWDDALLEEVGVTLKRVVFLYECLLELPVTIRRGDVAVEVVAFARERGAARVVTTASPNPRFAAIRGAIARSVPVETRETAPLVAYGGELDLRRFSRFWGVAKRYAFGQPALFELVG